MKKKIKIICIFVVISFILQTSVLLILNNKVFKGFADDNTSTSKNVVSGSKAEKKEQVPKNEIINVDIDDNRDINISKSNKYISYIEENKIIYIDIKNKNKKSIDNIEPLCYKWTFDDNIIVAAKSKSYTNSIDIYLYDINTDNLKKIQQLKMDYDDSKIQEIISSPFKNILFIKVKSESADKIYKINIKNEIETVETVTRKISNMALIPHEDKVIYKSNALPKFYITYCDKKIEFDSHNQMILLGVDEQDRIYVAEKSDDKIINIYSLRINDNPSSYNKIQVNKKIDLDNIVVADDSIYYIDKEKSLILNLENNKETKFKGNVISINKKEAFIIEGKKIEIIKM